MLTISETDADLGKSRFIYRHMAHVVVSRCIDVICAVTPCHWRQKYCLFKTRRHVLKVRAGRWTSAATFHGNFLTAWVLFRSGAAKSPREPAVAECVADELKYPRRPGRRRWKPGTPPGTLPTQTCSCSPTPAAFSAPCKPLLCPQSVGGEQPFSITL